MELDEGAFAFGVDQSPGVDTETLHHSERSGNSSVGKDPHAHGGGLRTQTHPVPCVVVSGLCLRDLIVRLWLQGVHQVGELNRVLDEEDGNIY